MYEVIVVLIKVTMVVVVRVGTVAAVVCHCAPPPSP